MGCVALVSRAGFHDWSVNIDVAEATDATHRFRQLEPLVPQRKGSIRAVGRITISLNLHNSLILKLRPSRVELETF